MLYIAKIVNMGILVGVLFGYFREYVKVIFMVVGLLTANHKV